jgi:hypothetical protein
MNARRIEWFRERSSMRVSLQKRGSLLMPAMRRFYVSTISMVLAEVIRKKRAEMAKSLRGQMRIPVSLWIPCEAFTPRVIHKGGPKR